MAKIKVIQDDVGKTLTVWFDDPNKEHLCEETREEVVLMKDHNGRVIGFEMLHYEPETDHKSLTVETVLESAEK